MSRTRRGPAAAALIFGLALYAVLAAPALGQSMRYVCDDDVSFTSEPRRGGEALLLTVEPGAFGVLLDRKGSSSGDRFLGGGYVFQDRHHTVLLTTPGNHPVECVADAGGLEPPAVAGPGFACRGSLGQSELEICGSPVLADLDRRMAETFGWLIGELPAGRQAALRADQRQWLPVRDACGHAVGCLEDRYYERIAYLNEYLEPDTPAANGLPRAAQSWGGIVRSGPGTGFERLAGLAEGAPITVLADTGVVFNGYNWFEIGYGDLRGFQWGGIICPIGAPLAGAYEVCD